MQKKRVHSTMGFTLLFLLLTLTGKPSANEFSDSILYETVTTHTDAGGINTCKNINKYLPESREQLITLVKQANQAGKKIILTGSKHSMAGQVTCHREKHTKQYILVSLEKMPIQSALDDQYLSISAQATWSQLISILKQDDFGEELAPSIMQDFSVFTIGGSMSANAMGRNPRFAGIIDSIKSFTLLKADGEVIECSREQNSTCFEAVIGGYGAFGVILEASILLVPDVVIQQKKYTLNNNEYAEHLRTTVRHSKDLDKHYGLLEIDEGQVFVNIYEYYELSDKNLDKINKNSSRVETTRREYLHNHRFSFKWGDLNQSSQLLSVAVPLDQYENFSSRIPELVANSSELKFHEITTKYLPNQQSKNMLQLLTEDSVVFVFMIENQQAIQDSLDMFKKRLYQLTQSAGGKPYLAFDLPKNTSWLMEAYPRAGEWLAMKRKFDPNMTFYNQFFHNFNHQISNYLCNEITKEDNWEYCSISSEHPILR